MHKRGLNDLHVQQNPEHSSPLNCDAANLLRNGDKRGYDSLVRMYAQMYGHESVSEALASNASS